MTILGNIAHTGFKISKQQTVLASGFWESGNAGSYNLQSGALITMKDLNAVVAVLSVVLTSGPSTLLVPSYGDLITQSGGQLGSITQTNVVQVQIQGTSGNLVSGAAVTSGVQVNVIALGY